MNDLINDAKKGNKLAFTNIILEKSNVLYKIARARLKNIADIDDAIQNTMIKAYLNLIKLKDNSKFDMWLTKILINECNEVYRKNKLTIISYDEIEDYQGNLDNQDIDSKLEYDRIMNFLEYEERTLVVLHYGIGYTTKQMSDILNTNENTIKTRLKRLKEKLQNKFKGGM